MIEVSAGIVRRRDGTVLICQRGEGRLNAHLWEFPGGKREPGEDAAACLRRELMEELSLPIEEISYYGQREAQGFRLTFLNAVSDAEPKPTEHEAVRFVQPRELLHLPLCPADSEIGRQLALREVPLRAFLWDYDGTLVDSYPHLCRSLIAACRTFGIALQTEEALALMKQSLRYAVDTIAGRCGLSPERLMESFRQAEAQDSTADVRPFPGMAEALGRLAEAGGRHFLVTHNSRACLDVLEQAGLKRFFTGWVTSEDGFPRKPAPDSVLYLLQRWQVQPQHAVMIGDRPLDTAAGRSAGILSCLVDGEGRFPKDPCELRAACVAELPDLLLGK